MRSEAASSSDQFVRDRAAKENPKQSFLNVETQGLKNEVLELQKILEEINSNNQQTYSNLQKKDYSKLIPNFH